MNSTGSPQPGEPLYLVVGRIRRSHGIKGEMLFDVITDFPERIVPGTEFFFGDTYKPVVISKIRDHNKGLIIQVEGVNSIDETEIYRNQLVYVPTGRLPALPAGEYYFHQLIGLQVFDESDIFLGVLDEILETGANDVLIIKDGLGAELLVPFIDSVVISIDLEEKKIIISPPEWY